VKCLVVILFLLPQVVLGQQNLVPNHSFEYLEDCPIGPGYWSVIDWSNANGLSPDNFNACASSSGNYSANVPLNYVGFQEAYDGEGYVGFACYISNYPDLREYVQAILTDTLTGGIRYYVGFYCNAADGVEYAISTLGAVLTTEAPPMLTGNYPNTLLDAEPQVLHKGRFPLTDTANWVLISDTVMATGGERYITIGNFHPDGESDTIRFNPNQPPILNSPPTSSYYYIDDVFVYAIDSVLGNVGIKDQEAIGFELWPNPATEVVRFRVVAPSHSTGSGQATSLRVRVLDAVGRVVRSETLRSAQSDNKIDISTLPTGIYFLELIDREERKTVRKFVRE
jgi:hypothetical protein